MHKDLVIAIQTGSDVGKHVQLWQHVSYFNAQLHLPGSKLRFSKRVWDTRIH